MSVNPIFKIKPKPLIGKIRILVRLIRFAIRSLVSGYYDFVPSAVSSSLSLICLTVNDVFVRKNIIQCNICGWSGNSFYRHTGPGYDEPTSLCPGCLCQDRHRTLLFILERCTDFYTDGQRIVEVAPERNLEKFFLTHEQLVYTSFDIERNAMEQGDITQMRYEDNSIDYFLCFHVLEHISEENKALNEIHRVLKPDGQAIVQVPVDWDLAKTYEYPRPDPRDTYHVRQYGKDFAERLKGYGFEVIEKRITDCLCDENINRFGCSREPLYFIKK